MPTYSSALTFSALHSASERGRGRANVNSRIEGPCHCQDGAHLRVRRPIQALIAVSTPEQGTVSWRYRTHAG